MVLEIGKRASIYNLNFTILGKDLDEHWLLYHFWNMSGHRLHATVKAPKILKKKKQNKKKKKKNDDY